MTTIKRFVDFIAALILTILLSPVMAVCALAVFVSMGSPVLFRQQRPGLFGQTFTPLKLRTMNESHNAYGEPLSDSERLTNVVLRETSLDELPQLFNVLLGDMSLVGPRPLLPQYMPYYTERESLRHLVLPGITGWAQVNGRNSLAWDERLEQDAWYVENWSLWLDVKIAYLTIVTVFNRDGLIVDAGSVIQMLNEERLGKGKLEISSFDDLRGSSTS
jgi:lipopolysaccharide/colanic/teichoic acid biosynthesis glycosyltransferase